ncbi:MAG: squalene--hopene cyclase [Candidatus Bruticola sp.]
MTDTMRPQDSNDCNSEQIITSNAASLPQPPQINVTAAYSMSEVEKEALAQSLNQAIDHAVDWLKTEQTERGYWAGFLKTNSAIEAEWIMAMYFLGIDDDPKYNDVVRSILNEQRPDGSWSVYYGSTYGDINATVESYTALKIAGHAADAPHMQKARQWIISKGGLKHVRVFTRFWLALLGEWPWEACPNLPPEIILLPNWFPINLYKFASWGRATIAALCLISADHPVKKLPADKRLDELFPQGRNHMDYSLPKASTPWGHFFAAADKLLGLYTAKSPIKPLRKTALKLCEQWIIERQEKDGCWAGIQPPWIYALIGLYTQGYSVDHPVVKAGLQAFNEPWAFKTEQGTYLQCCTSPVWDTVLSLVALSDCNVEGSQEMVKKALRYTLDEQIMSRGDWQVNSPHTEPGGWAFEYENDCYPDVDDSAVALTALLRYRSQAQNVAEIDIALKRGFQWLRALRSANGAWGAFDKNNDCELVCQIPFCDFGEVLDPPSADVTAHVIEAYGTAGQTIHQSAMLRQAVNYLRQEQEADGSWFGRWGVNYIYGTGLVLPALQSVGVDMQSPWIKKAADWLVSVQKSDGGWGESCATYMDPSLKGQGSATPSQTAWALMGLLAMEDHSYDQYILKGLSWLTSHQKYGSWEQKEYTGTGFPGYGAGARTEIKQGSVLDQGEELSRGFMLNYAMYRHYFPMMALGRARRHFALPIR